MPNHARCTPRPIARACRPTERTTLDNVPYLPLVDAIGTFAFALSGGALAVQKRFDIFGVLFLALVVAVAGGMVRDLLIGAVPPAAIADWHAFALAIVGGLVTFFGYPLVRAGRCCCSKRSGSACSPSPAPRRRCSTASIR